MRPALPLIAVTACVFLAVAAAPRQPPKDAQATFEPSSSPGSGQELLVKFVGDWEVGKVFYPRAGEPVRASGTCRQTMIHGGRFLQSDFVFRQDGRESTGQGLIGYEPESGTFTSVWTDSRQTRMSLRRSRDKFDGETIVLYSGSLEAEGKPARQSRTLSRLEDGGRKLTHKQYALGPDGEPRLMMELVMTRKGATPAP